MRTPRICDFPTGDVTFGIIKPDAYLKRFEIMKIILEAKFNIINFKSAVLGMSDVNFLYYDHRGKEFFQDLADFTMSGSCVLLMLAKKDAVLDWRELMGSTDSSKAGPMTLRSLFGDHNCIRRNAVHGSDSTASAKAELLYFFPERSI